eukprot:g4475.t1
MSQPPQNLVANHEKKRKRGRGVIEERGRDAEKAVAEGVKPRKADFRQRAHCNPLSDFLLPCPISPLHVDWSKHYPGLVNNVAAEQPKMDEVEVVEVAAGKDLPRTKRSLFFNTADYPLCYHESREQVVLEPKSFQGPDFLDVGCGFGGLSVNLAEAFPHKVVLGLEIREQVTNFVGLRIQALREKYKSTKLNPRDCTGYGTDVGGGNGKTKAMDEDLRRNEDQEVLPVVEEEETHRFTEIDIENNKDKNRTVEHHFLNASVLRTNAMKSFPNYFRKQSLEKIFFCFPDPHFKKKTHRRRIVNASLLDIYAYSLKSGEGKIYTITDVKDLHEWMHGCLQQHPLFEEVASTDKIMASASSGSGDGDGEVETEQKGRRVGEDEKEKLKLSLLDKVMKEDECVRLIHESTEEGHKVQNLGRFGKAMSCAMAINERSVRSDFVSAAKVEIRSVAFSCRSGGSVSVLTIFWCQELQHRPLRAHFPPANICTHWIPHPDCLQSFTLKWRSGDAGDPTPTVHIRCGDAGWLLGPVPERGDRITSTFTRTALESDSRNWPQCLTCSPRLLEDVHLAALFNRAKEENARRLEMWRSYLTHFFGAADQARPKAAKQLCSQSPYRDPEYDTNRPYQDPSTLDEALAKEIVVDFRLRVIGGVPSKERSRARSGNGRCCRFQSSLPASVSSLPVTSEEWDCREKRDTFFRLTNWSARSPSDEAELQKYAAAAARGGTCSSSCDSSDGGDSSADHDPSSEDEAAWATDSSEEERIAYDKYIRDRSRSRAPASEVADSSSRSPAATFNRESSSRPSRIDFFCDEKRAGGYDYATNWTHKRVKKGHVPLLKKYARGNCLEVAAGTGGFLKYYEFFSRGGNGEGRDAGETENAGEGGVSHLVLFDSSAPMLKRAHLRAVGLGIPPDKITLRRGDVNELKMLAGRHEHDEDEQLEVFDTVIDVLGLCSYDDPQEAVRQMFSVLRPGGHLILSEHGESDWELIRHAQRRFWEKNMRECGCDSTLDMFALVEGQCQKLRGELKESERLRSLETQRLAAQIGKMRLDLVNERERIQTLEREFSLAFDAELQRLKQKHESETTKEAIIVVERLKKDLAKVEREKADLMSKLAAVEKTTKITNRKQKIASAYSAGGSSETELQILSGGSGDGIMY